jgi:hypothetical protein
VCGCVCVCVAWRVGVCVCVCICACVCVCVQEYYYRWWRSVGGGRVAGVYVAWRVRVCIRVYARVYVHAHMCMYVCVCIVRYSAMRIFNLHHPDIQTYRYSSGAYDIPGMARSAGRKSPLQKGYLEALLAFERYYYTR